VIEVVGNLGLSIGPNITWSEITLESADEPITTGSSGSWWSPQAANIDANDPSRKSAMRRILNTDGDHVRGRVGALKGMTALVFRRC